MMTTKTEEIAAQTEAAIAAGADPLGDNDPLEVINDDGTPVDEADESNDDDLDDDTTADEVAAGASAAGDADGAKKADADDLSIDALEAIAGDEPSQQAFEVDKTDFKAKRAELSTREQEIEDKWTAGELTDGQRNKELGELRDQRDELTRQQTRAETLQEMNQQQAIRHQAQVLRGIATQSQKAGHLDYSDAKVGTAYDAMFSAVAADPANDGKKFSELAQLAHEALCAVRGIKVTAAPATAPTPAPVTRKAPGAPPTLRNMPAAATPHTGGDALDAIANLKGQAYQDAFARLSPAQQRALVDG